MMQGRDARIVWVHGLPWRGVRCDWDHVIPAGMPAQPLSEFQDWCKGQNPKGTSRPTGAQHRGRKRGGDE